MDNLSCPFCASSSVRLRDAIFTIRLVERTEGGRFVERKCAFYRCFDCGRTFDEIEAEEGVGPE